MSSKFYPTEPNQRIELLDVLRGIAIMGVLFSNIFFFSGIVYTPYVQLEEMHLPELNQWINLWTTLIIKGKFYPILAILFGAGLFMQFRKSKNKGFLRFFLRRMGLLVLIGAIHQTIWPGDVVSIYALFAFLFIPFRNMKSSSYLVVAVLMLFIYFLILFFYVDQSYDAEWTAMFQYKNIAPEYLLIQVQENGWQGMALLVKEQFDFIWSVSRFIKIGPNLVLLFSLGAFLYGSGFLTQKIHKKRYLILFLIIGLMGSCLMYYVSYAFKLIDNLFLALAYMSAVALLIKTKRGYHLLKIFIPYGRMALSNYILQTIILIIIFYGIGFGCFARLPIYLVMLIAFLVLIMQLYITKLWLRKFRFGPIEYLWRKLSYGLMK